MLINEAADALFLNIATKGDIDIAVAAAKEAFKSFGFSSKEERIELLENIIL